MKPASFYRTQAERARRVANAVPEPQIRTNFWQLAQDFEEIAEDLERGTTKLRHPELLPIGTREAD